MTSCWLSPPVPFSTRGLASQQRWTAFTAVTRLGDGILLSTFRRGSQRDSPDGHVCVSASTDLGETGEERYDGHGKTDWEGVPGEDKALLFAEVEPGRLVASGLWVDRSQPNRPGSIQPPVSRRCGRSR
jgi:hypothetical protein